MKKMFIICILYCLSSTFTKAQFEPGQKVLGGNIGFSTTKNDNATSFSNTSTYGSINPSFAKFRKANLLRGVELAYGHQYQKASTLTMATEKQKSNIVGIAFFSQRFFSLAPKFFFTVNSAIGGNYQFGKQTAEMINTVNEAKISGYGAELNFAPGITYKLSERLLFDAHLSSLINLSYSHVETKPKTANVSKSTQNSFNISSSLSNTSLGYVGLGFRWLARRK